MSYAKLGMAALAGAAAYGMSGGQGRRAEPLSDITLLTTYFPYIAPPNKDGSIVLKLAGWYMVTIDVKHDGSLRNPVYVVRRYATQSQWPNAPASEITFSSYAKLKKHFGLRKQHFGGRRNMAAKFPLRSKLPAGWKLVGGEYKKTYAKGVLQGTVVKYGKKYEGYFTAHGRVGFPAIEMSISEAKIARELDKIVGSYRSPATAAAALRQSSRY